MTLTSVPQHLRFSVLAGSCDVIIHPREHRDNALILSVVYFQTRRSDVTAKRKFIYYVQTDSSAYIRFWAAVCKTVRPMLSARCLSFSVCLSCLSCLSVTLVYCGQTVWRFKMELSMQVGLGSGHIVLDGDPAPPPQRGNSPPPTFRPIAVAAKCLHRSRFHLVWR